MRDEDVAAVVLRSLANESAWSEIFAEVAKRVAVDDLDREVLASRHAALLRPAASTLIVCGDLEGLPPVLIHVGEEEMLLSDAQLLADRIRASGGDVTLEVHPRMFHGWHFFMGFMPEAGEAIRRLGAYVRNHVSVVGVC